MNTTQDIFNCLNLSSSLYNETNINATDKWLTTTFISIFLAIALIGNISAVIVVYRNRDLHDPSGILIGVLSVADVGVGVFSMIAKLFYDNPCSRVNVEACILFAFVSNSFIGFSHLVIALITLDRCIAIVKPLHYHIYITRRRLIVIIFLNWINILLLSALPMMGLQQYGLGKYEHVRYLSSCWIDITSYNLNHVVIGIYFVPLSLILLVVITCYVIILIRAKKSFYRITTTGWNDNRKKHWLQKSTRTTVIVVGVFLICNIPSVVITMATFAHRRFITSPVVYKYLLHWGTYINVAVNPFLFGLSRKDFRRGYYEIFSRCCSKKSRIADVELRSYQMTRPFDIAEHNLMNTYTS